MRRLIRERPQAAAQDVISLRVRPGYVGPGYIPFFEKEEHGQYLAKIAPVALVIRLQKKLAAGRQPMMHESQELGCQQSTMDLRCVVIGLRVIAVDLGNASGCHIPLQELCCIDDGEAKICKPTLVAPTRRVANHHRENIDAQVVQVWSPHGASQKKAAIATTKIENDFRLSTKEGRPIEWPFGRQRLEGGPRPLRLVEDFAGNGHAEFAFD